MTQPDRALPILRGKVLCTAAGPTQQLTVDECRQCPSHRGVAGLIDGPYVRCGYAAGAVEIHPVR